MKNGTLRFSFLAVLALALVAFVACSGSDAGGPAGGDDGSDGNADAVAAPIEAGALGDRDEQAPLEPGAGGEASTLPQTIDRKIIRTATISLELGDVMSGMRAVENIALTAGGFVSGSSVSTGDDESGPQTATITIRVPAGSYSDVMNQLRTGAESVRSESSETSEVTEEYTDLQSRLRNLQATEAQYLLLLGQAQTIDEILTVQDRLNGVRGEIEQVTGRINQLDNLTELATINVNLFVPVAPESTPSGQNWAQRAWEASWEASRDVGVVLGSVAIALGVLAVWMLPIVLIGALAWRLFGRRIAASLASAGASVAPPPTETPGAG